MKYLILVPNIDGHHLEYTEHLIKMANKMHDNSFVFSLHPGFKEYESSYILENNQNIFFDYLTETDVQISHNPIIRSIHLCKLLNKKIKRYHITDVFLIMLTPFGPFINLPIWRQVNISSIIYSLYPYEWKTFSIIRKIYISIYYWLIAKSRNIKTIFVLNDNACARLYNRVYHSTKFKFLVDPYPPIEHITNKYDLRRKYKDKIIISHIGFLKKRKGSYDILEAIQAMDKDALSKYVFVFVGKSDNAKYLQSLILKASYKVSIEYIDKFVNFEEMGEIVNSSDLLLLPYHNTNQSSGIIGYGAQFNVPVAVPNSNLLGSLVKRYNLGYFLKGHTKEDIIDFLSNHHFAPIPHSEYLSINNIENFIKTISCNI